MTEKKSSSVRSPSIPSYDLETSLGNTSILYEKYRHGKFSKSEIATALNMSAQSSGVGKKIFAMAEYGLIVKEDDDHKVTDNFHTFQSNDRSSNTFKNAAINSIRGSDVFSKVLDEFPDKLPDQNALSKRLETKHRFNAKRASEAASILEKSLRYSGVLDEKGNILPVRVDTTEKPDMIIDLPDQPQDTLGKKTHKSEIPLANERIVVVQYPHDLTSSEAEKVANVLKALVS